MALTLAQRTTGRTIAQQINSKLNEILQYLNQLEQYEQMDWVITQDYLGIKSVKTFTDAEKTKVYDYYAKLKTDLTGLVSQLP